MENSYEVDGPPEGIMSAICEDCRTLCWAIEIEGQQVLVERKIAVIMLHDGTFVEGFIPHADICKPLRT